MESKKKDAYLHLMYRAFVEVRLYSAMYHQIKSSWWNPFRWTKFYRYLRQINRLADAFHNLPLYLKSDSTDFDEESFWNYLESYEKQYVTYEKESYKSIFIKVVEGEKRKII